MSENLKFKDDDNTDVKDIESDNVNISYETNTSALEFFQVEKIN